MKARPPTTEGLPRRGRQLFKPNVPKILTIFRLQSVPLRIPYADAEGFDALYLDLPGYLTEKEIRVIGAACRIYTACFCCGDLLLWLAKHPEAPHTWQEVRDMWIGSGLNRATIDNYKSNAKAFRRSERTRRFAYGFHDAVRTLPQRERLAIWARAEREHLSVKEVQRLAKMGKEELDLQRTRAPHDPRRIAVNEIAKAEIAFGSAIRKLQHRPAAGITEKERTAMESSWKALAALYETYRDKITKR